jgi:hypothetical protein
MRILLLINRTLFFISFFLPFILLPHCEGPSEAEEKAKAKAIQDSILISDSINQVYESSTTDTILTIHHTDTAISTVSSTVHPDTAVSINENQNILSKIHSFLKNPTEYSISGYGIASLTFNSRFMSFLSCMLLLSFILSIVGVFILLIRRNHIVQTIISVLSLLSLIVFLCLCIADNTPMNVFLWGFWTSLTLSVTNVIITIIIKRMNTSR